MRRGAAPPGREPRAAARGARHRGEAGREPLGGARHRGALAGRRGVAGRVGAGGIGRARSEDEERDEASHGPRNIAQDAAAARMRARELR